MTRPSWQDLNAYVDGELTPAAAAEVAAAVAADRELAARIATLARLKAAAGDALAVEPAEVPQLHLARPPARPPVRPSIAASRSWLASAAGILLVVVLGIGGWATLWGPGATGTWLATAEARHLAWLSDEPKPVPIGQGSVQPTATPGTRQPVPDLGFAGLAVAHLAVDASGRQPGLYVGYVGTNGCRLGLWIGAAAKEPAAGLVEHRRAGMHSFTWKIGDTGYAVMARDMDPGRLAAIAGHLERLTRARSQTQIAGLDESAANAPCVG